MRDLKILYLDDIDKNLLYSIHELKLQDNGFYTINKVDTNINVNEFHRYCYVITPENKILEQIYKDKVYVLKQVLENLYQFKLIEDKKTKEFSKKLF